MTIDQTLHLLAILAWPIVAIIAGYCFLRGCTILESCVLKVTTNATHDASVQTTRWTGIVQSIANTMLPNLLRDLTEIPRYSRDAVTSERALLAILTTTGAFPGSPADNIGRRLVREVRKMYSEIDHATPEPLGTLSRGRRFDPESSVELGDVDEELSDEVAEDVFGDGGILEED